MFKPRNHSENLLVLCSYPTELNLFCQSCISFLNLNFLASFPGSLCLAELYLKTGHSLTLVLLIIFNVTFSDKVTSHSALNWDLTWLLAFYPQYSVLMAVIHVITFTESWYEHYRTNKHRFFSAGYQREFFRMEFLRFSVGTLSYRAIVPADAEWLKGKLIQNIYTHWYE